MLVQIIRLVEQAQSSKAPIQRLAYAVAGWFVPVVIFVAIGAFMARFVPGPEPALTLALVAGVAVLIIACPCALGLATPLGFFAFAYNAAGIHVAAGILYPFVGIRLSPMIAAVAMAASSLSVVLNANRMRNFTPPAFVTIEGGAEAGERNPTAMGNEP